MAQRRELPAATGELPAARRATIRDVATSLGLSPAAVSLALNGKGTIAPATRERIVAEATRLGYVAHPFARGLRGGRSGVLALSIRSLDASGAYRPEGVDHFSRLAGSAAFTALDHGLGLLLVPHRTGAQSLDVPTWVDGYVVEDPVRDDPLVERLVSGGLPVVTIGWDPAHKVRTSWVSTADQDASRQVLDLFAERGARRICFVSGTDRNSWNIEAERAYRAWCRRHDHAPWLVRVPERSGEAGGFAAGEALLARPDRPDAIYCQTGRHAAGAARAAVTSGLRIPDDVLVAAGTDSEQTRSFDPPITSVDLQPETLGRHAVELLTELLSGAVPNQSRSIPARLLHRGSTERPSLP